MLILRDNQRFSCLIFLLLMTIGFLSLTVRAHQLEKNHLIISATRSPLVKDRNLSTISSGVMEQILLDILSEHLKFTYEICPPSDSLSPGYLRNNGSWTGIAGQLQRNEVDMCVSTVAPAPSKISIMDISHSVIFVETGILIPFPSESDKMWIDASVFHWEAWIALAVSFALMIGSAWYVNRVTSSNKRNTTEDSLFYWFLFFFRVWTSQGITLRNSSGHLRIICVVSFLGIYIICNYFTASYTSVLSIPIFKTSVDSVEDLANSDTIKTLIIKGSSTDEYILASTDPTIVKIGDQVRKYPERRITNAFTVEDIATIVKDEYVLVIVKSNGESLIQQSYELNNKTCKVTLAENSFFGRAQTFSFPKNSPIAADINRDILLMDQAGLLQYAQKRSAITHNRCSVAEIKKNKAAKVVPLTRNDVIGAFFIMIVGSFISLLAFITEIAMAMMKKKRSTCKTH